MSNRRKKDDGRKIRSCGVGRFRQRKRLGCYRTKQMKRQFNVY